MKIVSFTKVSNDCELIESFVRYNSQFVDKMIFLSGCCVDNSAVIIRKLIEEGYNIDLIEDPDISFEERFLDNYYQRKIAEETDYDLIIPLDTDEFLTGNDNPRKIMEGLSMDRVYYIVWLNYILTPDDDLNEAFIPKRLTHINGGMKKVTKAILPCRVIRENGAVTFAGRHSVVGESLKSSEIEDIWYAHFPTVSREQYILRIYECSIKNIIRRDLGNTEGGHKRMQYDLLQKGIEVNDVAAGYGYVDTSDCEIEKRPMNLSFVDEKSIECKYHDLAQTSLVNGLLYTGQLMAIKAYQLEVKENFDMSKKTILVFGTGYEADILMNGVPENMVNVLAYIDNDPNKQLGMYNRRLVIPPHYCRFFKYDKIIIASTKNYDSMAADLKSNGVKADRISGSRYLFEIMKEYRYND